MQIDNEKSHLYFIEQSLGEVPIITILAQAVEVFFMAERIVEKNMLEKPYWLLLGFKQQQLSLTIDSEMAICLNRRLAADYVLSLRQSMKF